MRGASQGAKETIETGGGGRSHQHAQTPRNNSVRERGTPEKGAAKPPTYICEYAALTQIPWHQRINALGGGAMRPHDEAASPPGREGRG